MSRRDQLGTFLGKGKRAIAPPPTISFTLLSSKRLYGTYFLALTPHYSKLPIWLLWFLSYPKQKVQTSLTSSTNGPFGSRFSWRKVSRWVHLGLIRCLFVETFLLTGLAIKGKYNYKFGKGYLNSWFAFMRKHSLTQAVFVWFCF